VYPDALAHFVVKWLGSGQVTQGCPESQGQLFRESALAAARPAGNENRVWHVLLLCRKLLLTASAK
jgi:hypothetical protein